MILADKIIHHRKKNGWSQEDLAEMMNVSRQSVSKWEGAQSIPDLEKIIKLSEVFGVSTDYLLKDEMEDVEYVEQSGTASLRKVTMEEANDFLSIMENASKKHAFGIFLIIIAPIFIMILGAYADARMLSEELAGTLGVGVLLILIAAAIAIFITTYHKTSEYEFIEKEPFETEYGVTGMVKERKRDYKEEHFRKNVLGIILLILSPIPTIAGGLTDREDFQVFLIAGTLLLIGLGVWILASTGMRWASMNKLLQEGEYSTRQKQKSSLTGKISGVFWLLTTGIYLYWSFTQDAWDQSWLVWPIAGVVFGALMIIVNIFYDRALDRK